MQKRAQDGICLIWSGTCSKVRKNERKDPALHRLNGSNPAPSTLGSYQQETQSGAGQGWHGPQYASALLVWAIFIKPGCFS